DASAEGEFLTEDWIGASFTPKEDRSAAQNQRLAVSNKLANEVLDADILVLGVSMYNFGLPSAMKAWIDQIARPGMTFRADPDAGYVGLATGKTAYVVVATGETRVGGEMDYLSGYLRHILGFIGINDVHIVAADLSVTSPATVLQRANLQIDSLF
ncbi:MAG: FMN-dependent NADH-azoreductase, partial [Granulosicoccus sp.]